MVNQSRASFEIVRPVTSGAEHVVQVATGLQRQIFAPDTTSAIVINAGRRSGISETIGTERLIVYPRLQLPLVEFGADGDHSSNVFYNAADRLTRLHRPGNKSKIPSTLEQLPDRLRAVRLRHDEPDAEHIKVDCVGVVLSEPPQRRGYEFGLVVADSALFADERNMLIETLRSMARMRQIVGAKTRYTPVIPVALMTGSTSKDERLTFQRELLRRVPLFHLTLGAITLPRVN